MNNVEANRLQSWSENDSFTVERYRQFGQHLPKGPIRVLDCACNTGRGGRVLKQVLPEAILYGIDLIPERVRQIPAGVYEETVAGSSVQLPFASAFFDAIVAGEFVEHVNKPDLQKTFAEFRRVLKPAGRILLTTPNPASFMVKVVGRTYIFDDPSHVNIMTPDQLRQQLGQSELKLAKVIGSGRASRYVGERFPIANVYGSYLAIVTL